MVRMVDLPATSQASLEKLACPVFATHPWVQGTPLAQQRRVALISSAGLMLCGEKTIKAFYTEAACASVK